MNTSIRLAALGTLASLVLGLVGCAGADGSDSVSEDSVKGQDAVAELARQLELGAEHPSPVVTMRQFGDPAHPNRVTLDARGEVLAITLTDGTVLDGFALGATRAFGLRGYPQIDHAMGGKLGWDFKTGSIAMEDPRHDCDFTGAGPDDPGYPKCIADANAELASTGPTTLGSHEGVLTAVTIGNADVPLSAVYLATNHRTRLGAYESLQSGAFVFAAGRVDAFVYAGRTISTASVLESGASVDLETCTDDGSHTTCRYLAHGR